ncbi:hypothetical protein HJG53_16925 [Sphingomonas sp. ID1715]|uniref:DUF6437 family protein n=1 Tax=Sphingomonas sp. ID1715 TaxID=1656898 RepID=UPI0014884B60|nr:DUF6437 family protein [Sphingomonas sp. ID1715]NNM78573.1 hypothetical protein [Sphingomonas sp. ID1715]
MTKRKQTAIEALDAFEREQEERAKRQDELRRAAALQLGFVVLKEGGGRLSDEALRACIKAAVSSLLAPAEAAAGKGAGRG